MMMMGMPNALKISWVPLVAVISIEENGVKVKCLSTLEDSVYCFHEGKKS